MTLTREPSDRLAVVAVVAGVSVAAAGLAAIVALALEERGASGKARRRAAHRGPAWRRALGAGALVAVIGLLRAIDGLTVLTGGFVLAGFALAELVLSTRPAPTSR